MISIEHKRDIAPVFVRRCPAHHQLVAFDGDGRLLGRCAGCMNDASLALEILKRSQG